jgi:Xaa-Pro dipeptidase
MDSPDFSADEYQRRLERAHRHMRAMNLDALFFTTEAEMAYFTGFRTLFWQSPTRPWFLVLPRDAGPIAVIPQIGAALMSATWVEDIRVWSSPHADDDGITLLTDALRGAARIGMPMGRESMLRMPLSDFERLRRALRSAELVDATPIIQALRMVKSPAEIEKIARICAIASAAFAEAPGLFAEGQRLDDAFRAFRIELLRQGAEDVPYLVGGAGPDGYDDVISPAGSQKLKHGDVLMLDTGARRQGYFCDFDRNFAIGRASDAARKAYAKLCWASDAALGAVRPGLRCCDLYEIMVREIGGEDGDVGRLGHGLGLQLTEPPSIVPFDETLLEPGMVITLEPSMQVVPGKVMVHEEVMVVRDGPPELISQRAPAELPVL